MQTIERVFQVNAARTTVYNQWTQFEDLPQFMGDLEEVRQVDDTHLHFRGKVAGISAEWDAEITEQVPDQLIAWRSTSGPQNAGEVRFDDAGADRTQVHLRMEYDNSGAVAKIGDATGIVSSKMDKAIQNFTRHIEAQGSETGAWRDEVHAGQPASSGAQNARGGGGDI